MANQDAIDKLMQIKKSELAKMLLDCRVGTNSCTTCKHLKSASYENPCYSCVGFPGSQWEVSDDKRGE